MPGSVHHYVNEGRGEAVALANQFRYFVAPNDDDVGWLFGAGIAGRRGKP